MHYDDENDYKVEPVEGRLITEAAPSTIDFPPLISSPPAISSEASDREADYEDDEDNLIYVRGYN